MFPFEINSPPCLRVILCTIRLDVRRLHKFQALDQWQGEETRAEWSGHCDLNSWLLPIAEPAHTSAMPLMPFVSAEFRPLTRHCSRVFAYAWILEVRWTFPWIYFPQLLHFFSWFPFRSKSRRSLKILIKKWLYFVKFKLFCHSSGLKAPSRNLRFEDDFDEIFATIWGLRMIFDEIFATICFKRAIIVKIKQILFKFIRYKMEW